MKSKASKQVCEFMQKEVEADVGELEEPFRAERLVRVCSDLYYTIYTLAMNKSATLANRGSMRWTAVRHHCICELKRDVFNFDSNKMTLIPQVTNVFHYFRNGQCQLVQVYRD